VVIERLRSRARNVIQLMRFMRILSNGHTVFRAFRGANVEIRTLDFRDGTRFHVRDGASAVHIFEDIFVTRCYDFPEVRTAHQIVDVGANIGLFAYFARRQNPTAKILAIEADPHTTKILQSNVEGKGIDTLHCAVSDQAGTMPFYSANISGWSSLYDVRGAKGGERVSVPAMRLSRILQDRGIGRIGLLKVDVEGAEYPILLEDKELWNTPIDAILVEVDHDPRDTRYSFSQFYELLRNFFRQVTIVNPVAEYPLIYATGRKSTPAV